MRISIAVLCLALANGALAAEPQSAYRAPATFTAEGRSLHTKSAFALLTNEYFGGRVLALKILHTTRDITPEVEADFRAHGNTELTGEYENATLVLFLDQSNAIQQVNLTVVLNGRTVGNTVASSAEELKKFGTYSFDGKHLRLKSEGMFESLSWKVDDDLPVFTFKARK